MVKEKVENETNESRFRRIAGKRANNVLYNLRLLGNCANKSFYSYDPKQVSLIFSAIDDEIKVVKALFNNHKKRKIEL